MSGFHDRHDVNKTRKEHKCMGCFEQIPIGSSVTLFSGLGEGGFYRMYFCIPCVDYVEKHPDDFEEGLWEGCVRDMKREREEEEKG